MACLCVWLCVESSEKSVTFRFTRNRSVFEDTRFLRASFITGHFLARVSAWVRAMGGAPGGACLPSAVVLLAG